MDWIQGDKFKALTPLTYSPTVKAPGDYDNLENTLDISKLSDVNLVYTHTIYAKQLFEVIAGVKNTFVIITHNADINVDSTFILPGNVIKWYTQNVNVTDSRIESIPIGLENDRWFKGLKKKEKMEGLLTKPKKIRNWVYMNHNINTNMVKRAVPYYYLENKYFVSSRHGMNGHNFDEYIDNVYHHRFVICPEGNGLDTHRTWEALYLGTIPIEKKNINNQFYKDLPISFVRNWDEVTEDFLAEEYARITTKEWNLDKLKFEYWKNKILRYE